MQMQNLYDPNVTDRVARGGGGCKACVELANRLRLLFEFKCNHVQLSQITRMNHLLE